MKPELAKHLLRKIEENFNRAFGTASISKIMPDLLKEPDKAIENAYDFIILNYNPPNMPTAAKLLEIVQKEAYKIKTEAGRIADERQANYKRYDEKHLFNSQQRNQLAKMSLMSMRAILSDKPDHNGIIRSLREISALHPGIGMGEVASELEQNWKRKGYL